MVAENSALVSSFVIRKQQLNPAAMWALAAGILLALIGYWVPALSFLDNLSWFTGFLIALRMNKHVNSR